ncbi:Rhodanese-like domain-containing protein [Pyronema domesticum]|uniref:Similar to CDC25-like phosphatase YCH1 acc. no. P42937 n=1 Tax=Pyronema omphalodes (strain CBS 100304) TaxID=1076935 RepID=U4LW46_PYROM|nr:Rhodanese-like domain-containing protein [Pyronema domesticum]CCX33161.1 Similar to CDC25-like phosphatase YCH1; acc. no. P42937 [Pyronema omphalodes CBS 100304]
MSSITAVRLTRISPERLSNLLLTVPTEEKVAVIDVRDSDHIGGHIKGSRHVPSGSLSYTAPELVRTLQGAEKVVFHCALSQERGPSAALRYMRERERLMGGESIAQEMLWEDDGAPAERDEQGKVKKQRVFVLDGGFVQWQQKFGMDERLTENYNKELWADGW